jgi:SAM-dependent methyltransferase/uncharacterized protein YbaR (Trm112 family)
VNLELLTTLACPDDRGHPLSLASGGSIAGPELLSGQLLCPLCGRAYEVIDGVPDLYRPPDEVGTSAIQEREIISRDHDAETYYRYFTRYQASAVEMAVRRRLAIEAHDRVLDLGCGTARFAKLLSHRCREWVAVDFSLQSLAEVRRTVDRTAPLHLVRCDVNRLPLALGQRFDRILATELLEHIPTASLRHDLLDSCAALLADGGRFVLTTYNYSQERRARGFPKVGTHPSGIYYYCYDAEELKSELELRFDVAEFCGVRNRLIPSRVLERMPVKAAATADLLISHTPLSLETGHLLLAVCQPRA